MQSPSARSSANGAGRDLSAVNSGGFSVGDWEGDTIESAGKNAYIATFVDRKP
jgi:IS30 family transposase